jgi:hypothetical protein
VDDMTQSKADKLIRDYVSGLLHNKPDEAAKATKEMVEYIFAQREAALNSLIDSAFMCQRSGTASNKATPISES